MMIATTPPQTAVPSTKEELYDAILDFEKTVEIVRLNHELDVEGWDEVSLPRRGMPLSAYRILS